MDLMVVITYITWCKTAELRWKKKTYSKEAGKPRFKSKKYKHKSQA